MRRVVPIAFALVILVGCAAEPPTPEPTPPPVLQPVPLNGPKDEVVEFSVPGVAMPQP